jgi:hypothetical protein
MKTENIQENFFRLIKQKISPHLSLADEIASLLNISQDSAYRRIRCEKPLMIDEIQVLAIHYGISLDSFMNIKADKFIFSGSLLDKEKFKLENYLQEMINTLERISNANRKYLYYLNKDVPIFQHFMFPELACFKCYFWSRYNLNYPQFNKGQFLISDFIDVFNQKGAQISDLYMNIPSTEVWNIDCINTTIRQIDFYRETKIFRSAQDIITIYNCLEKLLDHIEEQTEYGYKFPYKKNDRKNTIPYFVYINEFLLGDNTVAVEMNDDKIVFVSHSVLNYIATTDKKFVDYVFETIQLLIKKSTLISNAGEKDRQIFFETIRERIHDKKKLVS